MFFRRNEGEYRETDRVTRFKLIKSGKQWLRAATSNFGLFKVVKGGADAPSVSAQSVEEKTPLLSGQALLKGIAAAGAVAGGAVATYTAQAEETTTPALESQVTANQDVAVNSEAYDRCAGRGRRCGPCGRRDRYYRMLDRFWPD